MRLAPSRVGQQLLGDRRDLDEPDLLAHQQDRVLGVLRVQAERAASAEAQRRVVDGGGAREAQLHLGARRARDEALHVLRGDPQHAAAIHRQKEVAHLDPTVDLCCSTRNQALHHDVAVVLEPLDEHAHAA